MISRQEALQQLSRLHVIPFPPPTDEAMEEILQSLIKSCRSLNHAKNTITALIESPGESGDGIERWPTPKSIRMTAWGLLSEQERTGKTCGHCIEGWKRSFLLRTRNERKDSDGTVISRWWDEEQITEDQYRNLVRKIDWLTQQAYAGVQPCECSPNVGRRLP